MLLEISRVTNDEEHETALKRIDALFDAGGGAPLDELNILAMLVDRYESERWPIPEQRDPIEIIEGAIEHAGRSRDELVALVGSAKTVDAVLARRQALSLDMIRALSSAWGIPPDLLMPPYPLVPEASP